MPLSDPPTEQKLAALQKSYRSGSAALDQDFFRPCFAAAISYDRAVGYFTSHALASWGAAVPRLVKSEEVHVRLVVGPVLLEEDRHLLAKLADPAEAHVYRQRLADVVLLDAVEQMVESGLDTSRLQLFGYLLATEKLQLRFAFPEHVADPGDYHEKFGIFSVESGQQIAFSGSANETAGGHRRNYEQVDVYRSWVEGDSERVQEKVQMFRETWTSMAPGLAVLPPTSEVLERVSILTRSSSVGSRARHAEPQQERWRHQDEAVEAFIATDNLRGILEMATGSGKTKTSLKVADRLLGHGYVDTVIVATSGTDLLNQWHGELLNWPTVQNEAMRVYRHFSSWHDISSYTLRPTGAVLVCSRLSLASLMGSMSREAKRNALIIHDEVHGFGSPAMQRDLRGTHAEFAAVLGLSATPEREYDDEGNSFIDQEVGPTVYRFTVKDAIKRGILVPFRYIPLNYDLTDGDRRRLNAVHAARHSASLSGNPMSEEEFARRIAFVYKTAESKPRIFASFVHDDPRSLNASLLFVETQTFALEFGTAVGKHTTSYSTYFEDDSPERLRELSSGQLDCLICCKRLSEGVDVKHLRTVFLTGADRARLQTIQRIGRTLRRDPSDALKVATVVDWVLRGAPDDHPDAVRSQWLTELAATRPEGSARGES